MNRLLLLVGTNLLKGRFIYLQQINRRFNRIVSPSLLLCSNAPIQSNDSLSSWELSQDVLFPFYTDYEHQGFQSSPNFIEKENSLLNTRQEFDVVLQCLKNVTNPTKEEIMTGVNALTALITRREELNCLGSSRPIVEWLLQVDSHVPTLNMDELVSTLIVLKTAGVPLHHHTMNNIISNIVSKLREKDPLSLKSLANFAVFLNHQQQEIYPYFLYADALPHIAEYLQKKDLSLSQLSYIAICMGSVNRLITREFMSKYKRRLNVVLNDQRFAVDADTLISILTFLAFKPWCFENNIEIRRIMFKLLNKVPMLSSQQMHNVLNIHRMKFECAPIVREIERRADKLRQQQTTPCAMLIHCSSVSQLPEKRKKLLGELNECLDSNNFNASTMSVIRLILRNLQIHDEATYNKYCNKILSLVQTAAEQKMNRDYYDKLFSACSAYISIVYQFVNYNNAQFESEMVKIVLHEMQHGLAALLPYHFCKLAEFVIAFGINRSSPETKITLTDFLLQKVNAMAPQLSSFDCLKLSNGLQIYRNSSTRQESNKFVASHVANKLERIENIVNERIERFVEMPSITLTNVNSLIKTFKNRRDSQRTIVFEKLLNLLETKGLDNNIVLSSFLINDICASFKQTKYIVPTLCAKMLQYVYANQNAVSGKVAGSMLYSLYILGYDPYTSTNSLQSSSEFDVNREIISNIIERDFDLMSGLSIVRTCLALSFYRALSIRLINCVFNLNFIERLEKEISLIDTNKYSSRSLNHIMQLNRAVCFGYPEAKIPWFKQNFVEANLAANVPKITKYDEDVYNILLKCVKDASYIRINHITPYGYRIPYVVYFNSEGKVVPPPLDDREHILNKVAILPLRENSYCRNKTKHLLGEYLLQERHLGILGYRVIQICYREWNSMHMNLPGAKEVFLKKVLRLAEN